MCHRVLNNSTDRLSNLTETLTSNLSNPVSSFEFELNAVLESVLSGVGLSAAESGGKIMFYGKDPIVPSCLRFGSMAVVTLAAKVVAAAGIWKFRSGEGQDTHVDVRKALQRFAGFFELKWELINGRPASFASDPLNRLISNRTRSTGLFDTRVALTSFFSLAIDTIANVHICLVPFTIWFFLFDN
jgi:hypothetical protein